MFSLPDIAMTISWTSQDSEESFIVHGVRVRILTGMRALFFGFEIWDNSTLGLLETTPII